jgi:DNA polymerase I-like protein with 3'-5' exonuclease and polymerase domains
MAKIVRPRKQVLDSRQVPMFTQPSNWTRPSELPDLTRYTGDIAIDSEELDNGIIGGMGAGWAFRNRDVGGYVAGVSVAYRDTSRKVVSLYVPVEHPDTDNFDKAAVGRWIKSIIHRPKGNSVFCNAGYDLGWFNCDWDIELPDGSRIHDVGAQAMLIDENRKALPGQKSAYSLDSIAKWCGVSGKDEKLLRDAALDFGYKGEDVKRYIAKLPARYAGIYGEQDAVSTLLSHEIMMPKIAEEELERAYETEMGLIPCVHMMRKKGVRLNEERCAQLGDQLMDQYRAACQRIFDITKMRVTIDEIRQRDWLIKVCDMHGIDEYKKEDEEGNYDAEFSKDWMRASQHPLPRAIAEAKQCHEASTKFVHSYLLKSVYRGRIHANINQFKTENGGTRSHRFSYSEPPLQQMPSRPDPVEGWKITEIIAQQLRMSFEPEPGHLWFAPDYSQQEYRLICHYAYLLDCRKADMAVDMYNQDPNTDFHNLVVALTGLTRRRAKDVNFAKAYGAGVKKFALMTGMTLEEAAAVMGQYDGEMPFVKELNEICEREAQNRGYIRMIDGARSHFDDWEPRWLSNEERRRGWAASYPMAPCRIEEARERCANDNHPWFGKQLRRADTRKAMNRLIQGSAARQVKMAMLACWRAGFVPMLQIHDELAFSLKKESDGRAIGTLMREVIKISVPMRVDEEYGMSWGTAKYSFKDAKKSGKGALPALAA